jgi:cytochrome P450
VVDGITLARLTNAHHEAIEELRAHGPVVWVEALGAWMVLDRALAIDVLRDAERFTVDDPRFATAQVVGSSMLSLDGAEHRRHRDPFATAFRPPVVTARFAPRVAAEARSIVERLRPAGRTDLVASLAGPLAAWTAAFSLGLDSVGSGTLLGWYRRIVAATEERSVGAVQRDDVTESARQAMDALRMALTDAGREPDTALAEIARSLSEDELVSNAAVFLFGAIETTEGMIANLLSLLVDHPSALEAVRADRSLVDRAIEESLRIEPSVARVDRYATTDVSIGGVTIGAGDFVVVSLAGANRDPTVYAVPHEFRLDRDGEPGHITFVHGPHACLGAQLARVEARAAVDAVLDQLPELRRERGTTGAAVDGIVFRKPRSLRVRWDV